MPDLLLALLLLGTAGAIWLGLANAPSTGNGSTFLDRAVAATARSGSAQFTYSLETRASGPEPNGTDTGFGSVSFSSDASDIYLLMKNVESQSTNGGPEHLVNSQSALQEIITREGMFQKMSITGVPVQFSWIKFPEPATSGPMGALVDSVAGSAINPLLDPSTQVEFERLGPATVDGAATTEYQRVPIDRTCTVTAPGGYRSTSTTELTLWIDRQGRVRQVRSASDIEQRAPTRAAGRYGTVAMLTFEHFGTRVAISDPPVHRRPGASGGIARLSSAAHETCSSP